MSERKAGPASHQAGGTLRRELGVGGAVMLGLGSIVGTGVFVSIGLGAGVAGPAVVLGIVIAGMLATCNGLSSAQLAAAHPVAGGTYEYGYTYLTPALGFTAGWMFLAAKSASAATAALGLAGYALNLLPEAQDQTVQSADAAATAGWDGVMVAAALVALVLLTLLILTGLKRTSFVNITIVSITLIALFGFVLAALPTAVTEGTNHYRPFFEAADEQAHPLAALFHASALMFVAYTGYGRIATMGEEIRRPRRSIPIAIIITLGVSALLYATVALAGIGAVGTDTFFEYTQRRAAPLEAVMGALWGATHPLVWLVAIGAITAMLGVLLNLILGLSRVALAMGRRRDLPGPIGALSAGGVPVAATLLVMIVIAVLVSIGSVRHAWSFSAFTVLVYYGITNLAALRLPVEHRRYPRALAWTGLFGCLFLAFWVEPVYWGAGLGLIAVGLMWHAVARRLAQ